jgi:hypothetical protein
MLGGLLVMQQAALGDSLAFDPFSLQQDCLAAPFVGVSAASFVIAEAVRLHDGPAYFDIRVGLGDPGKRLTRRAENSTAQDAVGLTYVRASDCRRSEIGKEIRCATRTLFV